MSDPAGPRVLVGDLLVATPNLLDPNFEHTVVLLLDVDDARQLCRCRNHDDDDHADAGCARLITV